MREREKEVGEGRRVLVRPPPRRTKRVGDGTALDGGDDKSVGGVVYVGDQAGGAIRHLRQLSRGKTLHIYCTTGISRVEVEIET